MTTSTALASRSTAATHTLFPMAASAQTVSHLALELSNNYCALETVVRCGREAILAHASELEDLAGRCGQPGAMHGLLYLLDHEYNARKLPHLILFFAGHALVGSVLMFEYRIALWKTGVVATGDQFGVRTVVGPEAIRPAIAVAACSALLARQAKIVLASFKQPSIADMASLPGIVSDTPQTLWTLKGRNVRDHLPLAATYDATLAQMGKRTRTHLRYYRRRLEHAVPCEFLPDVAHLIDPSEATFLRHLNRTSLGPIAQEVFNLQYRATAQLPGGFVSGLRSHSGRWLSLAGGWRQGDTTWVQWQMNTEGLPSYSLSTVLRSFLIEAEIARGMRHLGFHGGTSHSMGHAFPAERVFDLVGCRAGTYPALAARFMPWLYSRIPTLSARGNFLADALRQPALRWCSPASLPELFGTELASAGAPASDEQPSVRL